MPENFYLAPEFSNLIHGFLSPYVKKKMLAPELYLVLSTLAILFFKDVREVLSKFY
jgi:hypothetical protein